MCCCDRGITAPGNQEAPQAPHCQREDAKARAATAVPMRCPNGLGLHPPSPHGTAMHTCKAAASRVSSSGSCTSTRTLPSASRKALLLVMLSGVSSTAAPAKRPWWICAARSPNKDDRDTTPEVGAKQRGRGPTPWALPIHSTRTAQHPHTHCSALAWVAQDWSGTCPRILCTAWGGGVDLDQRGRNLRHQDTACFAMMHGGAPHLRSV